MERPSTAESLKYTQLQMTAESFLVDKYANTVPEQFKE
jgi:hypothetical protein